MSVSDRHHWWVIESALFMTIRSAATLQSDRGSGVARGAAGGGVPRRKQPLADLSPAGKTGVDGAEKVSPKLI